MVMVVIVVKVAVVAVVVYVVSVKCILSWAAIEGTFKASATGETPPRARSWSEKMMRVVLAWCWCGVGVTAAVWFLTRCGRKDLSVDLPSLRNHR